MGLVFENLKALPTDDDYIREALESLSNDFEEVHCTLPDVDPESLFMEVENLGIF